MIKILIVDDEEHFIETVKRIIKSSKLDEMVFLEARDGLGAFDLIKKENPDIILTDMNMPYSDGVDLLKKCTELELKAKIIIISGYDNFTYTRQAIKSGIIDYLLKPVNPYELISVIEKVISKIVKGTTDSELETGKSDYVVEIKRYLEENYTKQVSLDYISQMFYLSKGSILKRFKAVYGIGVYEYVMQLRMEKAKHLLSFYNYQIQEVSTKVGFNDSNYFTKAFRKYFGYPPKHIKNTLDNN